MLGVAEDGQLETVFTLGLGDRLFDHVVAELTVRGVDEDEIGKNRFLAVLAGDPLEAGFVELGYINA